MTRQNRPNVMFRFPAMVTLVGEGGPGGTRSRPRLSWRWLQPAKCGGLTVWLRLTWGSSLSELGAMVPTVLLPPSEPLDPFWHPPVWRCLAVGGAFACAMMVPGIWFQWLLLKAGPIHWIPNAAGSAVGTAVHGQCFNAHTHHPLIQAFLRCSPSVPVRRHGHPARRPVLADASPSPPFCNASLQVHCLCHRTLAQRHGG